MKETKGTADGITYDETEHTVTIKVVDDGKGHLIAEEGSALVQTEEFINTFEDVKASIEVTKHFNDWGKADSFTFVLAAVTPGAPIPEKTEAIATKDSPVANFGEISYEESGVYEYAITEKNGEIDGVTYDVKFHKVVVTVTKDEETNKLTADVKYDGKKSLIITNTFTAATAKLQATKEFKDWGKADSFTFKLEAVTEGAPMPERLLRLLQKAVRRQSLARFPMIRLETYEYTIIEVNDHVDGVSYDTTPHKVVVTVSKGDNNKLTADVKYDGTDQLTITNTFTAVKATLEATKQFSNWGKAGSFTFNLAAVTENAPMPEEVTATATEKTPIASFGEITYDKAGTYEYTITEVNDGVDGVSYDTTPHKVVVTVSKDAETNALTAEVKYDGQESLTITNTYEAAKAELNVTKEFNDWGKADSFTFNLAAVTADAPMPDETTATATERAPLASFGEITYDKAGTYEYTITEVNDGADGVSYDTTPHKAVVAVTKAEDETNALTAKVIYDESSKNW